MNFDLTPDQEALIQQAIENGRLQSSQDAVRTALAMWEEREHQRAEIVALIESSQASLAQGEGRTVTTREELKALADDVKRRGLTRLMAEQPSSGQ
jgi:Arc/MetJ-type ribon-helix-helix transcriptional regulator